MLKKFDKNKVCIILIYFLLYIVMLRRYIELPLLNDDLYVFNRQRYSSWLQIMQECFTNNGRYLTDTLAFIIIQNYVLAWRLFTPCAYCLIAFLFCRLFAQNQGLIGHLVMCFGVALYPLEDYHINSGYVFGATDYIYTFISVLLVISPLIRWCRMNKVRMYEMLFSLLGVMYATNHDQYAIALIMAEFGIGVYMVYSSYRKNKKYSSFAWIVFFSTVLLTVIFYAVMFFSHGHLGRMQSTAEAQYFLPQFLEWSFLDKLKSGYRTLVGTVFFDSFIPYIVLCALLSIMGIFNSDKRIRFVSMLPGGVLLLEYYIGTEYFAYHPDYAYKVADLVSSPTLWGIIIKLLTIFIIALIICIIVLNCHNLERSIELIWILAIGFVSRFMMGLVSSSYTSMRTYTICWFAIILVDCLLLFEIKDRIDFSISLKND